MAETAGKVFLAEQGMRRCQVCEELFTREDAAQHASVPCEAKEPEIPAFVREQRLFLAYLN